MTLLSIVDFYVFFMYASSGDGKWAGKARLLLGRHGPDFFDCNINVLTPLVEVHGC